MGPWSGGLSSQAGWLPGGGAEVNKEGGWLERAGPGREGRGGPAPSQTGTQQAPDQKPAMAATDLPLKQPGSRNCAQNHFPEAQSSFGLFSVTGSNLMQREVRTLSQNRVQQNRRASQLGTQGADTMGEVMNEGARGNLGCR